MSLVSVMGSSEFTAATAQVGGSSSIWDILDMCPGAVAEGALPFDPSPYIAFNDWVNELVLPASLVSSLVPLIGRLGLTYVRNLLLGCICLFELA